MNSSDLGTCGGCGARNPIAATSCHGCGEKFKHRPASKLLAVGLVIGLLLIFGMFKACTGIMEEGERISRLPKGEPSQKTRELTERAIRLDRVVSGMDVVKSHLRDPASLQWTEIFANADGTVICMLYRAKNGFGGMNLEAATIANNVLESGSEARTKHCAPTPLIDMNYAISK